MNYPNQGAGYRNHNSQMGNPMNNQMHNQMNTNPSMHHMNSHPMNSNVGPGSMAQNGMSMSGPGGGPMKGHGGAPYPVVSGQARSRPYHVPGSNVTPQQYSSPRRGYNPANYGQQQGQPVHSQTYPGNQVVKLSHSEPMIELRLPFIYPPVCSRAFQTRCSLSEYKSNAKSVWLQYSS